MKLREVKFNDIPYSEKETKGVLNAQRNILTHIIFLTPWSNR